MKNNQKGFSAIEGLLILIIICLIGFSGWYVWNSKQTSDVPNNNVTKTVSAKQSTPDPYRGWSTCSAAQLGVSVRYPQGWSIDSGCPDKNAVSQTCTGAFALNMTPDTNELAAASNASSVLKTEGYSIGIVRFGSKKTNCAPDGNDFSMVKCSTFSEGGEIKDGMFKGDKLMFWNGNNPSQGGVDTGYVFSDSCTTPTAGTRANLTYNDKTYQIYINILGKLHAQSSDAASVDLPKFMTTQLYKDSLGVISSITSN
jgi:hypothetical protein